MKSKIKICQSCKTKFTIEPEDFEFYEKIGVPAPTFCPECRMKRRLISQNWRKLYKRKCDFSGKEIITVYRSDSSYEVYSEKIWWSDKWDPIDYGQNYSFNKPFFEQFKKLVNKIPWPHTLNINSVNCDYCISTINSKNCYMCACNTCEDCLYCCGFQCKNNSDSFMILKSDNCYECLQCEQNYNLFFSQYADNCIDSAFLYNCRNCQNCFGCVNLRNKKYYIFNKPYSKKDYQKEIKKYNLGSFKNIQRIKKEFNLFKLRYPHKFAIINKSYNVSGNSISNTKNCHNCFDALMGVENCKYVLIGGNNLKDSYDIFDCGSNSEIIYDCAEIGGKVGNKNIFFSNNISGSYNITYSAFCYSSSNLFACVGLRHKQYCILNKQYTKEEYEELVPKIKQHMNDMPYTDKKGRVYKYGEFFPSELSPFGYNETIANEYFPLTKKQAIEQGYNWYDKEKNEYEPTIKAKDLPDNIKDVNNNILKEVIQCNSKDCAGSGVFRIIPQELKFYKKMNIPLPHLCPDCRHRERIKQRNPLKLYTRKCMNKGCNNTFETTYAPDRKDIVYCEKCYNMEVG